MRKAKTSEYLELVGRISSAWAVLELNFESMIGLLTRLEPREAACITSQFGSHYPKLKAVIALSEYKGADAETIKDLKKFLGSLNEVAEKRNRILHDAWLVKGGDIVGKYNQSTEELAFGSKIEDLEETLDAINRRLLSFAKMRIAILNETKILHDGKSKKKGGD